MCLRGGRGLLFLSVSGFGKNRGILERQQKAQIRSRYLWWCVATVTVTFFVTGLGSRRNETVSTVIQHVLDLAAPCHFPTSSACHPSRWHQNLKETYVVDSSHGLGGPLKAECL